MNAADKWDVIEKRLTKRQLDVVKWCVANGKEPYDACRAGLCSTSIMTRWRPTLVREWIDAYAAAFPDPATSGLRTRAAIIRAVPDALKILYETVAADAESSHNATKVRTAQWIISKALDEADSAPAAKPMSEGEKELANVLRLVK